MRSVHLEISGRVQGVGYRAWLAGTARELGLAGWVRNRHDGRVEALIAGGDAAVTAMLAACHEGPRAARVDAVEVSDAAAPADASFAVLPTA